MTISKHGLDVLVVRPSLRFEDLKFALTNHRVSAMSSMEDVTFFLEQ